MKKININKTLNELLKFFLFVFLFFVLMNANINMVLSPFAFGMLFALTWANQKVYLLAPSYLLAGLVKDFSFESVISLLCTLFVLVVPYFIHILCKKQMRKWEFGVFAVLSQTANIVFEVISGFSPILSALNIILGTLFMFSSIIIFEAIIIRGFSNKLTTLELVSLFVIVLSLSSGLVNLNIEAFSFLKLFVSFLVLVFSFVSTPTLTILVAIMGGLGALISTNSPIFVTPFVLWALVALTFKNQNRIFGTVGVLCVEILSGYYFKLYTSFGIIEVLPLIISCIAFLLLPKKILNEIAVIFNLSKDRLAMKNVVNRNRELLHNRLGNLAEVFNEMNIIYRNMLKKNMTKEEVSKILNEEICDKICSYCPERNHCHRTFQEDTKKVFDELIEVAFERGKVTLLDIPSYLTSRCKQTSSILGSVNALTSQYKKYLTMMSEVDSSKILIADQLLGISKVIGSLAKEVDSNISFDTVREGKIIDELTYHNIVCIDAVVYEKDIHTEVASLVVRNEDSARLRIEDCVGKVCGQKMALYESFPSVRPNYTVLNLKTAPRFDCMFGIAQKTKENSKVSGDTYSLIRLDGDRILFAISDGMGSGEKAENVSEISLSLVENFYKAGFDNEIILSTVNKLLNLHKDDIFSALDIGIVDLRNGIVDFVKMASPVTHILREDGIRKIDSSSLPIGIVSEFSPIVKKEVISSNDFIIMISDGVSDSFQSDESLLDELKDIKNRNPQEFADELLRRALEKNKGYAVDDLTVLVLKVFEA